MNKKRPRSRLFVQILTVAATVIAGAAALYEQLERNIIERDRARAALEQNYALRELQKQIDSGVRQAVIDLPPKAQDAALELKLKDLSDKIESVDQKTLAIRQAINPLNPDEVLTIARLTDEIREMRGDFKKLEESLATREQAFQESIRRETNASSDASRWLFVVLIPLLVNFFYTLWKDLRTERKERKDSTPT